MARCQCPKFPASLWMAVVSSDILQFCSLLGDIFILLFVIFFPTDL